MNGRILFSAALFFASAEASSQAQFQWPLPLQSYKELYLEATPERTKLIVQRVHEKDRPRAQYTDAELHRFDGTPLEARLNSMIADLDQSLRAAHANFSRNIPTPTVHIISKEFLPKINAFVTTFPTLIQLPIVWDEEAALKDGFRKTTLEEADATFRSKEKRLEPFLYKPDASGGFDTINMSAIEEAEIENFQHQKDYSIEEIQQIVESINHDVLVSKQTGCSWEVKQASQSYILAKGCSVPPILESHFYGIEGFIFVPTYTKIFVYEELLEKLSSSELKAVIAHELAHYYLNHVIKDEEASIKFYKLGEKKRLGPPLLNSTYQSLGNIAQTIDRDELFDSRSYGPQTLEYWALKLFVDAYEQLDCRQEEVPCPRECSAVLDEIGPLGYRFASAHESEDPEIAEFLDIRHYDPEELDEVKGQVKACAEAIQLTSEYRPRNPEELVLDLDYLYGSWEDHDTNYALACTGERPKSHQNLWEIISYYNTHIKERGCSNQKKTFDNILRQNLGMYNQEQEADEFALYLLQLNNTSIQSAAHAFLRLAELGGDPKCKAWKEEQKQYAAPLITDFQSSHHDACFRSHAIEEYLNESKTQGL